MTTAATNCMLEHVDYVTRQENIQNTLESVVRCFDPTAALPDYGWRPTERRFHEANYRVAFFAAEAVRHLCGDCLAYLADRADSLPF